MSTYFSEEFVLAFSMVFLVGVMTIMKSGILFVLDVSEFFKCVGVESLIEVSKDKLLLKI